MMMMMARGGAYDDDDDGARGANDDEARGGVRGHGAINEECKVSGGMRPWGRS